MKYLLILVALMSCTSTEFHGKGKGKGKGKGEGKGKDHDDYDESIDDYVDDDIDSKHDDPNSPEVSNQPDAPNSASFTCNDEVLKKCGDDITHYCSVPSDAPEDWLKRCIHDYYRTSFSADCVEAIFTIWDIIKKEKKLDDDYEPMASDIFSILECKKDGGSENHKIHHRKKHDRNENHKTHDGKDQKTHNGEHRSGWHSKHSTDGSGKDGENQIFIGLYVIVVFFVIVTMYVVFGRILKRRLKRRQDHEMKRQDSIQAVSDTRYIPLSTHV